MSGRPSGGHRLDRKVELGALTPPAASMWHERLLGDGKPASNNSEQG
jgi:hypothetical protein